MRIARKWIGFSLLTVVSLGAIGFSLLSISLSGVLVFDYNFDVFHTPPDLEPKLTEAEADQILRSVKAAVGQSVLPLIVVTCGWILAGFIYLKTRSTRCERDPHLQTGGAPHSAPATGTASDPRRASARQWRA